MTEPLLELNLPALNSQILGQQLVGDGIALVNVNYLGANGAAGIVTGLGGVFGAVESETWVVLSTGNVRNLMDQCSGVLAPLDDLCKPNYDTLISTINNGGGDTALEALLPGKPVGASADAASLEVQFVPQHDWIQLTYVFASDEYPEYANTGFNDIFAFFLNGSNVALLPDSTVPVGIDTVNAGNTCAGQVPDQQHPQFFLNNDQSMLMRLPLEMDGLTLRTDGSNLVPMLIQAKVNKGQVNTMRMVIADVWDRKGDSIVLLKIKSLKSVTVDDLIDSDDDGILDGLDNCPDVANPDQWDSNGDGLGDACSDLDRDGVLDRVDNCPSVENPGQEDDDDDGIGNACESLPPPSQEITWTKFTGGGQILNAVNDPDKSSFGFNIMPKKKTLSVNLEFIDHENGLQIKINDNATWYKNREDVYGVGLMLTAPCTLRWDRGKTRSGYVCNVSVYDHGEGGDNKQIVPDQFKLTAVAVDSQTEPPKAEYSTGIRDLVSGNIQAHRGK